MFNVVDTWFAGLISTEALAALSVSFPLFFIVISFATGTSTGLTALMANARGEGDIEKVSRYFSQGLSFGLLLSLSLLVTGHFFIEPLLIKLGAGGEYLAQSQIYLSILFAGSFSFVFAEVFNSTLMSAGEARPYRNVLVGGFILNLLLNPFFVIYLNLGIAGIAYSTVVSEVISAIYLSLRAFSSGACSGLSVASLKPSLKIQKEIALQALPSTFNMLTIAAGVFVIMSFVSDYGASAIAGYGLAMRIEQVALLPGIGLNRAVLAIVGQNYGAGNPGRVWEVFLRGLFIAICLGIFGALLLFFGAEYFSGFFTSDQKVISSSADYLRYNLWALPAYLMMFISVSCLQGLKRPVFAMLVGFLRQIPGLWLSIYYLESVIGLGLPGVWIGIIAVTWGATTVMLFYTLHRLRKLKVE